MASLILNRERHRAVKRRPGVPEFRDRRALGSRAKAPRGRQIKSSLQLQCCSSDTYGSPDPDGLCQGLCGELLGNTGGIQQKSSPFQRIAELCWSRSNPLMTALTGDKRATIGRQQQEERHEEWRD